MTIFCFLAGFEVGSSSVTRDLLLYVRKVRLNRISEQCASECGEISYRLSVVGREISREIEETSISPDCSIVRMKTLRALSGRVEVEIW